MDLFVANMNDQPNFLYHNNCDGSFTRIIDGPSSPISDCRAPATGLTSTTMAIWTCLSGTGKQTTSCIATTAVVHSPQSDGVIVTDGDGHDSSWADYDNDGDMDLFAGPAVFSVSIRTMETEPSPGSPMGRSSRTAALPAACGATMTMTATWTCLWP